MRRFGLRGQIAAARLWLALALLSSVIPGSGAAACVVPGPAAMTAGDVTEQADAALRDQQDATETLVRTRGLSPRSGQATVHSLQAVLTGGTYAPGSAVLFYAICRDGLQVFLVSADKVSAAFVPDISKESLSREIDDLAAALDVERPRLARSVRLRADGSVSAKVTSAPQPLVPVLASLNRALLPAGLQQELRSVRNLIVVPWGAIGTIPFAMLEPFADGTSAIDHFAISVAPGADELVKVLPDAGWHPSDGFRKPLVIGNPAFAASTTWEVPSLPGAEREARQVAKLLHSDVVTGTDASRDAVEQSAEEASLLYFATHGVSDPDRPLDGGALLLSGPTVETGMWTARAIQSSHFEASLAVLSACQTGLGGAMDGGIVGLARAFQLAGVPRVAMSLWSVDDDATALLMTGFIEQLQQHDPPEAMRRAMLATRARYPDPALWAPFVLFSSGR